jgi:hypothetical protein
VRILLYRLNFACGQISPIAPENTTMTGEHALNALCVGERLL